MKVEVQIPLDRDSFNTYPGVLKLTASTALDGRPTVELTFGDLDRILEVEVAEFQRALELLSRVQP